ncbi:MAG: ribonuclease P protein component [Bacteroidota bacterium]
MMSSLKRNSFPAFERIKSRRIFDALFLHGTALKQYPIQMIWMEVPYNAASPVKIAVSAPKRFMRNAVDRNRMKRMVRESYRINKHPLQQTLTAANKSLVLLFIVQSKTQLSFTETQEKIILLLQRLIPLHYVAAQ